MPSARAGFESKISDVMVNLCWNPTKEKLNQYYSQSLGKRLPQRPSLCGCLVTAAMSVADLGKLKGVPLPLRNVTLGSGEGVGRGKTSLQYPRRG